MSIKQVFLRMASLFTRDQVARGYGVTTDDSVILSQQPSLIETGLPESEYTVKYILKKDSGQFELLGLIRRKNGCSYKLRQNTSGTVFTVTENLFKLLFTKCN